MRVLVIADPVIPVPPAGYGGVERIVHDLITELTRRGHDITLLAGPGSSSPGALFTYTDARDRHKLARGVAKWRFRRRLAGLLDRHDVAHSVARLDYVLPALRHPIPKLLNFQNPIYPEQVDYIHRHGRGRIALVPCGEQMARPFLDRGVWRPIHNSTNVSRFPFIQQPHDPPYVAFLGRITPYKGLADAIQAARDAGIPLRIGGNIGTAPGDRQYFEDEIAPHLGRDGITYLGEQDDTQKATLLGGASALLCPIHWDEPFGIVAAESLACGTPVLSYPRGELPYIIDHEVTGYLCQDLNDLTRRLRQIDRLDRRQCRRAAEARFDTSAMVDKCVEVYDWLRSPATRPPDHWNHP